MAQKIIASLFTCIIILSSLGNGSGTYPAFEAEGESLIEVVSKVEKSSDEIPEAWSMENFSHQEVSVHFQIQKLLLYFHDLSHTGEINSNKHRQFSSIHKTGPPSRFL